MRITALALASFATLASAFAAPEPRHLMKEPRPIYFPKEIGTRWVYSRANEHDVDEIIKTETVDGCFLVEVAANGRTDTLRRFTYQVSEDGVALMAISRCPLGEQFWVFRNGPPQEPRWDWKTRLAIDKVNAEGQFLARRPEKITVPAGTFKAVRVEMVMELDNRELHTCWYAPGVGLIRRDIGGVTTQVLIEFRPGKHDVAPSPRAVNR